VDDAREVTPTSLVPVPAPLPPVPDGIEPSARAQSLLLRSCIALALLAGLPLLAIVVAIAAIAVNVVVYRSGWVIIPLMLAALVAVAAVGRVLLALARRPSVCNGEVEVLRELEPDLHALVADVARATSTRVPPRIVVIGDMNAYVREETRLVGLIPGRRTMAIGSPLFDILSLQELRAVVAHELGHFAGGDTRLGSVIGRTRAATVDAVASTGGVTGELFRVYLAFQLRISGGVSRHQEVVADHLMIRASSAAAASSALVKAEAAGAVFRRYLSLYVEPVVQSGMVPDIPGGFRCYVMSDSVQDALRSWVPQVVARHEYDTHPPLVDRLAAIRRIPTTHTADLGLDVPAARILRSASRWQEAASRAMLTPSLAGAPSVGWQESTERRVLATMTRLGEELDRSLERIGVAANFSGLASAARHDPFALVSQLRSERWPLVGEDPAPGLLNRAAEVYAWRNATSRGWSVRHSWDEPWHLVTEDGSKIMLRDHAAHCLAQESASLGASFETPSASRVPARRQPRSLHRSLPPPPATFAVLNDGAVRRRFRRDVLWFCNVTISPTSITVGKKEVRFDAIGGISVRLVDEGALAYKIIVRGADRRLVIRTGRADIGRGKREAHLADVAYIVDVLSSAAGPHIERSVVDDLRRGHPVTMGRTQLTREGITQGGSTIAWGDIVDVVMEPHGSRIVAAGDRSISVHSSVENVCFLGSIVGTMRAMARASLVSDSTS
jgi:Zn-dependent protease with chaperone function